MNRLQRYRKRIVGSVIIGLAVILIGYFFVFHGFVKIEDTDVAEINFSTLTTPNEVKSTSDTSLYLPSGEYMIQVKKSDNSSYIKKITVPSFLQTVINVADTTQHTLRSIGKQSFLDVGYVTNDTTTTYENGSIKSGKIDSIKPLGSNDNSTPAFSQTVTVKNGIIGGVIEGDTSFTPAFYDFETNKTTYYPTIELNDINKNGIKVESYANGFSLYSAANERLYIYTLKDSTKPTKQLSFKNYSLASYDDVPLYSASVSKTVVLEGSTAFSTSDNETIKTDKQTYKLAVFDASGEKKSENNLSFDQPINAVHISNDGSYIFLSTPTNGYIYRLDNFERRFSFALETRSAMWLNDNDLVFLTDNNSVLYKASVDTDTVTSLFANDLLAVSSLSFADKNNLYFTAFSKKDSYAENPDAYALNLRSTDKNANQLLRDLPYQGNGFYIQSQNNVIYIQLTRYIGKNGMFYDEQAYSDALKYITTTFNQKYRIMKYFTDIDVR